VDTERVRCIGCGKEGRMEDFTSEYGVEWTCQECYERYGGNLDNIKIRCGIASATISLTELCPKCRELVLRRLEEARKGLGRFPWCGAPLPGWQECPAREACLRGERKWCEYPEREWEYKGERLIYRRME